MLKLKSAFIFSDSMNLLALVESFAFGSQQIFVIFERVDCLRSSDLLLSAIQKFIDQSDPRQTIMGTCCESESNRVPAGRR